MGGDGNTVPYFTKLGISNEMDLRADSEVKTAEEDSLSHKIVNSSSTKVFEIIHYGIDYDNNLSQYNLSRNAVIAVMNDFIDAHNNGNDDYALYFHCRIGADRTGTLAYLLEGLLGATVEERYRDYELTVFFGLRERTRYYYAKGSNTVKFQYLKSAIRNAGDGVNEDVMAWFLKGSTDETADRALVNNFRSIMIDYNQ